METKITTYQEQVLRHLIARSSAAFPVSGSKLKSMFLIKGSGGEGSEVRAIIHALRKKNYPICANSRGYFYARDMADLTKFLMELRSRVDSIEEAIDGLQMSFHNLGDDRIKELDEGLEKRLRPYVTRAVRSEDGQAAVIMKFEVGADGRPIVPSNLRLI